MDLQELCYLFIILIFYNAVLISGNGSSNCNSKEKCGECIQTEGCKWCSKVITADSNTTLIHCQPISYKDTNWCTEELIVNPEPEQKIIRAEELFASETKSVQITPQEVFMKVRVGQQYTIKFQYKQALDYPVDLYYIMDLSSSMKDDKQTLSDLAESLSKAMQKLTSNFRLGFGSFVDKVTMPYVSTVPDKLKNPCKDCAPAYSFKHHLNLSEDVLRFKEEVKNAPISGNLDAPEGGFDAILQAAVCQKEIGWRPHARHLLVFSTDAGYHYAGDGKLAGIVLPHDGKCHLNDKGEYTHYLEFDYPSISQINKVVKENNINLLLAVDEKQKNKYKLLADSISGAKFGSMTGKSTNVVTLVSGIYKELTDSVTISTNASGVVDLKLFSSCVNKNGRVETNTCNDIRINNTIDFEAVIKVVECPKNKKNWRQTIAIKPNSFNEQLLIDLEIICECPCETETVEVDSKSCSTNGNLQCGICKCNAERFGKFCECDGTTSTHDTDGCMSGDKGVCWGRGDCKCNKCECKQRSDPSERYYGTHCECDNFSCHRSNNLVCSGKGKCDCGRCICNPGWSGVACDCWTGTDTCIQSGQTEVCSGRGNCSCGTCKCNADKFRYSGKYCEECSTCPGQRCEEIKNCVECQVFKTGKFNEEECATKCTKDKMIIHIVDKIEKSENDFVEEKKCQVPDDARCTIVYNYHYIGKDDFKLNVTVQKLKECPEQVDLIAIIAIVTGSIVLAGIIMLLIWKLCTEVHDRREYVRFEKERAMSNWGRGDNPLFKPPTSTFQNPTFSKQ